MRKLSQGRWRDAAFPASTIVIGAAVSLSLLGFWQVRFGEPLRIHGDHIYLLTFIKNSILGGSMWSIDLLGYPLIQNSVYYPSFDFSYKLILRFLSLFSSNVFVVLYWFYILSIVFVFLFGFISMRKLRFTNDVALIGALCFAITPFLALRATIHDFLALSYSVPLGVTSAFCAYQVRSLRDAGGFLSSWFTVLSIVIIGTSGLYYAFFSAAMIVLLGMVGTINHYRLGPITAALVAVF